CPYVANPGQGDLDLDGAGDACDGDSDGDGVPDGEDNCVAVVNPGQDDLEGDGLGDACDPDDDGDGTPDVADLCPAVADPSQSDIDGDGLGDACDADKDGDGVLNGADNCAGTPNPGQEDGNGDGVGDACESDWDGDGVANGDDDCPLDFDPGQEDLDGDGTGDACDPDLDGDGVENGEDGCPSIADPGQGDLDADGIGNVCDGDRDGDGDPNGTDCAPDEAAVRHGATEACNARDDDCDGATDEEDADGCAILYRDADSDGWGTYLARCLCAPAAPYTAGLGGDCNDGRADVNPGATEACGNATDDDCDGFTDEAGGSGCSTWYKDADTDGYGVEADAACLCSPAGGYTAKVVGDCNDLDRTTFPGRAEACNQKDDDCDGTVDEEDASGCADWLLDADRDGFGADGLARCLCKGAAPWDAAKGGDCDDGATAVHPGAAEACNGTDDDCDGEVDEAGATGCTKYWLDADGDGYGVALGSMCLCAPAAPYSAVTTGDCNDSAAAVHPGAAEACNLVDDDCNGVPDDPGAAGCEDHFFDNDQDGFGVSGNRKCLCAPSGKWSASADGDCNDSDKNVYPGAVEACNGRDDDCDAAADEEDALGCRAFWLDEDADGYGVAGASRCLCAGAGRHTADKAGDCDDAATAVNPGAAEACANGRDDDCDTAIDEEGCQGCTTYWLDADADGWGVTGQTKCLSAPSGTWTAARGGDCVDASADIHPGATESCNGVDDDCDGATDEGVKTTFHLDADGDGFGSATVTTQACSQPAGYVAGGTDCNDGNPNVRPGGTEQCNLLDDDCDGEVDEGVKSAFHRDQDGDGFGDPAASVQACAAPAGYVANSVDCDDSRTSVHPGAAEQCNGLDDNCDGGVDEGVKSTFWRDADGDGYGNVAATTQACAAPAGYVANAVDCNDAAVAVHPGAAEACNATDDDCDGAVDEGVLTTFFRDLDGDGYGNPSATTQACAAAAGWVADSTDCDDVRAAVHPGAAEACNGLDDDCDGGVDEGVLS
ncbi:MAG: thrombospondin type 3 repeat-containing protein, partial [Deltaproteobacteria bacterium]|nr:thrombospondin type 3 repeat-containing protein [Deltaproteobacteria bacterium]